MREGRLLLREMKATAVILLVLSLRLTNPVTAETWTLERALGFARTNSPDARIALQRVLAAQAGLEQANSAVWPQLSFQSSYTRTDNPMLGFGHILNQRAYSTSIDFNDVPDTDNLNVRGVLGVPLYAGGKIAAERRAARAGTQAARQEAEAIRQTIAAEVARAFFTVQKTRQFILATRAAVDSYETNLAIVRQRFDAGSALRADVLDFEVRLAQAREDLVRARNANALAQRALQNLLGLEGTQEFTVAEAAPALVVPDGDGAGIRPEFVAAAERTRAAEEQVRGAKSGYLPRVSGFGSLDYDRGWVTDGDGESYTGGLMLQWDLWDGWRTRGKVSEASANAAAAREQERKVRLAVSFETQQARLALQQAEERLQVGEKSVAQAEESLTLTRDRFAQGLALSTQLMDAQTALTAAQVRRADAQTDVQIAIAALRRALGLPILESE
jgi:outer membrane protein TolC